jgi:hypothetical protein
VIAAQIWSSKTVMVGVKHYRMLMPRYLSHFWPWVRIPSLPFATLEPRIE